MKYQLTWEKLVQTIDRVIPTIQPTPGVVVCVSPQAIPIVGIIADRLGPNVDIVYDSMFTSDERLPSMYYVVGRMVDDPILVVDAVCGGDVKKLSTSTGRNVKSFALIFKVGSNPTSTHNFVPDFVGLRANQEDEIVFPWQVKK